MYKRVHTFPKGISPKVIVKIQLEFELVYYDVAVEHVNRYPRKILTTDWSIALNWDR